MAYKYSVSQKMQAVPRAVVHALRTQRKSRGSLTDEEAMNLALHFQSYPPYASGAASGDMLEARLDPRWQTMDPKARARRLKTARDFYYHYGPGEHRWPGERHPQFPGELLGQTWGRSLIEGSTKMSPRQRKMLADYREAIAAAELSGRPLFYTRTRRTR